MFSIQGFKKNIMFFNPVITENLLNIAEP